MVKKWKTLLVGSEWNNWKNCHFQTYSSNPAFCDILNMFQSGSQQNFKVPLLDGEMLEDVGSRHHPLVRHQGARVVEGNYILTWAFQKIRSEPNKIKILMWCECQFQESRIIWTHAEIGKCVANVRTNQRPQLSTWWARQPNGRRAFSYISLQRICQMGNFPS